MFTFEDTLIDRMLQLAPFEGREHARRAFVVTTSALRDLLTDDEASWLSEALGPLPRRRRRQHVGTPLPQAFYRRVVLYGGIRPGLAREHAQVVCRALAEVLPDVAQRLQKALPQLADLFVAPEPAATPPLPQRRRAEPDQDHTLAGGRPGGSRPLYDARPFGAQPTSGGAQPSRETPSRGFLEPELADVAGGASVER